MPAILKVFDGAPKVMLHCAAFSDAVAKGTCLLSQSAMSQCISSETTIMPRSWQKSASLVSVSLLHTMPAGLWGLERMSTLHLSSATSARLSKSIEYEPSAFSLSGLNTTSLPLPSGVRRKGWYTGGWMITLSPGFVNTFTTIPMPFTMPGM